MRPMRCESFDEIAHELARESLVEAGARTRALAHAAECARCAARLRQARALEADLERLEAETASLHPSSDLEREIRAALRDGVSREQGMRRPVPTWRWAVAAAAAVTILALVTPALRKGTRGLELEPARAEFVPLQYGDPMTDLGSSLIVRVEIDPTSAANLGLSPHEEGGDHALEADLLLGEDGVARAIRLVR